MSKIKITFALILVLCLPVFAGCKKHVGTSEDNAIVEENPEEPELSYKFGFSCITMENPYFITLENSLRHSLEEKGYTLITEDPDCDPETQIEQIKKMIADGIDAIFLCPVSWDEITPALEALKEADVKIINIDSEVKDMDYADAFIGSDNYNAGVICATDLISQLPDGGNVIIMESRNQNSVSERISGFEETLANKGFQIVGRASTDGDLNSAREQVLQLFEKNPDVNAIMCGNDQMALGVLVSANSLNMRNLLIYGVDGSPDLKKELAKSDSNIRGTCAQSPIGIGEDAAEIALKILNGEDYEKTILHEVSFITAENVDMYGIDGWQ